MAQRNPDGSWQVRGRRLTFPVPIAQASGFGALYPGSAAAAARILGPSGLAPLRVAGRTPVVVLSVTYDPVPGNVLGAYQEIALGFVVRGPDGSLRPHIHQLPVTEEFTCEAGIALWGFPKWVARIRTASGGSGGSSTLSGADGPVLSMSTGARLGLPLPSLRRPLPLTLLSLVAGAPALVRMSGTVRGARVRIGGSTVIPGNGHPLAEELSQLGFPHLPALLSFVIPRWTGEFGPARTLAAGQSTQG